MVVLFNYYLFSANLLSSQIDRYHMTLRLDLHILHIVSHFESSLLHCYITLILNSLEIQFKIFYKAMKKTGLIDMLR